MADQVKFNIDLGELKDYVHTEGLGSGSLLKMDGYYSGKVTKIIPKKSQAGNGMFLVQVIVEDADEKGAMLLSNVLCTGMNAKNEPNSKQLGQFLEGCGFSEAEVRGFSAKGSVDAEQLAKALIGRATWFEAEAEAYEGKLSSKVRNYITKKQYDDAVAANAHRKPIRAQASFSGPPAGVTTGPTNVGGPLSLPTANGVQPAANPLGALSALGLGI